MNLATMHSETVLGLTNSSIPIPVPVRQDDEVRADMFAGMLLMPKSAVDHAFSVRKLNPATANPVDFYRVACWLGVGYSTLAGHLHYALRAITQERFATVDRFTPKAIRESVLGKSTSEELIIVDEQWSGRPVDAAVGDLLLLPPGTSTEGPFCEKRAVLDARGTLPSGHSRHWPLRVAEWLGCIRKSLAEALRRPQHIPSP